MRKRTLWLFTIWMSCLGVLLVRLCSLMLVPDGMFPQRLSQNWLWRTRTRVDVEHFQLVQSDDGRGRILYRTHEPWSGLKYSKVWITPEGRKGYVIHRETGHTTTPADDSVIGQIGLPDSWPTPDRAVQEQGRSGLEYTFDRILNGIRPGYFGRLKTVNGQPRNGVFVLAPISGYDVRTTIDKAWQIVAERALMRTGLQHGAVVVLDCRNNDILALASTSKATHNHQELTNNEAITPHEPGSIFKLVTAAVALDTYVVRPSTQFNCEGRIELPQVHMNCWRTHGHQTFAAALANSCDVALAKTGIRVGRQAIEEMALRLHLNDSGLQVIRDHPVLSGALPGKVFVAHGDDAGLVANTAIGQQDVRISPLQAALIASTVANGGHYRPAHLVVDIEQHGEVLRKYFTEDLGEAFNCATARKLADAMRQAVTLATGTAHALNDAAVRCAVKTGTAELSYHGGLGTSEHVNGWIAGFAPYDHPSIAFCVYAGHTKSDTAHRDVQQIVRELLRAYKQFHGGAVIT